MLAIELPNDANEYSIAALLTSALLVSEARGVSPSGLLRFFLGGAFGQLPFPFPQVGALEGAKEGSKEGSLDMEGALLMEGLVDGWELVEGARLMDGAWDGLALSQI